MMQAEPGIPQRCSIFPGRAPQPPRPSRRWGAGAALVVLVAVLGIATPEDAQAQMTPPPEAPQYLRATAGHAQVVLIWRAPESDGGAPITNYQYRVDASATWTDVPDGAHEVTLDGGDVDIIDETTVTVTGLTNGTEYTFEVRAENSLGAFLTADTVRATPRLTLTITSETARQQSSFTVTFTFSEAVSGFDADDLEKSPRNILVSPATGAKFKADDATTYTIEVTPDAGAKFVNVYVRPNAAQAVNSPDHNSQTVAVITLLEPVNGTSNTAPTAANKTVTTRVGTAYTFDDDDFGFADTDAGDTLASVKIVSLPAPGTLALDGPDVTLNQVVTKADIDAAKLTFTPVAGASGDPYATFTFKVNDGTDDSASTYTMTIDVTAAPVTNTAPTAANKTVTTRVGTAYTFDDDDFGFADTDAGDTLASVKIVSLPAPGTLALDGPDVTLNQVVTKADIDAAKLTFTPVAGASGTGYASFTFTVNDGTVDSASAYTMTIDVTTAANTAPTAADNTVTTDEDTVYTFSAADFNFSDTDSGGMLSSVRIVTLPASGKGALALSGTAVAADKVVPAASIGNLTYTPPANANGTGYASFTFKVSDGTDESVAAYTMNINVTAGNDPATGEPAIFGTARVGRTLTVSDLGIMDVDGLPSASMFTYQWFRKVGATTTSISGANSSTYTLQTADLGNKVAVRVSFIDRGGSSEMRTSGDYPTSGTVQANNTLVSNVGQSGAASFGLDANELAQSFMTGDNADGYTLISIELTLKTASGRNTPTVKLYSGSPTGTEVSTLIGLAMLDASTTKNYTFRPSPTVTLLTSTTYWVVAEGTMGVSWLNTASTSEDGTSAMGWLIGDSYESRPASSTGSFTTQSGVVLQIRVNGTTVGTTPNNAPTAADNTVTTAQDTAYTFTADDFGFMDDDAGATLASVKIVTLPAAGTLALDGPDVTLNQVVTKADIDAAMLTFTPVAGASGTGYASFTFTVNDGTVDSASAYTMTITVTRRRTPEPVRAGRGGGGGGSSQDEHGNTPAQATLVTLDPTRTASVPGRLNTAADVDYFSVAVPHAGVLVVETSGPTATMGTVWQDGEELATADSGGVGQNFRLSARVAPGSVVIAVAGNGRQTGAYTLQVTFLPGYLENPGAASFQSGLGLISGWVCDADEVEITLNGELQEAAYGTARLDTAGVCGDSDNGFGLLFNWNLLGDGEHEVVALVDGVELDRATVTVTTLGTEFLREVTGMCTVEDFPTMDETVTLAWQQTQQNFVIAEGAAPTGANRAGTPGMGYLENPGPNSFQSGIGVLSGWVCEGDEVVIELNGEPQPAAYGTERLDTLEMCGDTANGFGLLFNWNLLGEGEHEVVAYVDGEELGRATVRVTTLGAEFVRGVTGECMVEDFPMLGETVTLEWQQNSQNFVITEVEGGSTL